MSEGILLLDGRGGRDRAAPSAAQQAVNSASSVKGKVICFSVARLSSNPVGGDLLPVISQLAFWLGQ